MPLTIRGLYHHAALCGMIGLIYTYMGIMRTLPLYSLRLNHTTGTVVDENRPNIATSNTIIIFF